MTSKMKAFLKLTVAALLSFVTAPLYASEVLHATQVQKMGFTEANQGLPFTTSKDMTQGVAADGSLAFSLDLHFGTDTLPVVGITTLVHYDSEKIEVTGISNIVPAHFAPDPLNIVRENPDPPAINVAGKSVVASTDEAIALGWGSLTTIDALANATLDAPVRVATIQFKWKAGAAGNSNILITEAAFNPRVGFHGTSTTLQGPAQAKITARPKSIDATTTGPKEIRVNCALSRPVSTEVTCALGDGAANPDDYTAPPAMNSATITIPQGKISKSRTFSITPEESDAGKTLEIALQNVSAANRVKIARDPETARVSLTKPGLEVSKESITTKEGGREKKFKVRLTLPPSDGGDVVVAVSSTDTGEATVKPALLRFTAENWDEKQEVTVSGANDNFDDGDKEYTINLAVDDANTRATRYHGVTAAVSGITVDTDEAKATLKASTEYLSETGGKQRVVITAKLDDSALFETETRITLKNAGGTATEVSDYRSSGLPGNIVIPARAASASLTFSIRTKIDALNDEKETILIAGEFDDRPGLAANDITLTILEFNLDADGDGFFTASDGILIMRYLMGIRGESLTSGQTKADPAAVAVRIEKCKDLLDVSEDEAGKEKSTGLTAP